LRGDETGLQWQDIDTGAGQIMVRRTWLNGQIGKPKTEASEAPVPLQGPMGEALSRWRAETPTQERAVGYSLPSS
jgi:integrase